MKILKFLLLSIVLVSNLLVYSQARKPTIMVVPSDNWCYTNNYIMEHDIHGRLVTIPNYQRALIESSELHLVISKINEMMAERGFPLKSLESTIKSMDQQAAEDILLVSRSGADIIETSIDRLKTVANADIWLQISWNINQMGPRRSISFTLQGIDAYTNKQIAGASGTGPPSLSVETPVMLEEAVISHIDNFNYQLQRHFNDLFENGREIVFRVVTFSSFIGDLENEYGGYELHEIIENWVAENTVKNRFSLSQASENRMFFEQVRIPLYDQRNRAIDARSWARSLQRTLKDNYNIDSKLMTSGLGQAQLVIGER